MEKEFASSREVEDYYRAVTFREAVTSKESNPKPHSPVVYISSIDRNTTSMILDSMKNYDKSIVCTGHIAFDITGEYDKNKFKKIDPMHYVVLMMNPQTIFEQRQHYFVEELTDQDDIVGAKRSIKEIGKYQAANLVAAEKLSKERKAGLSIIFMYKDSSDEGKEHLRRQAEYLRGIISQVATYKLPKTQGLQPS